MKKLFAISISLLIIATTCLTNIASAETEWWKPYSAPCVKRDDPAKGGYEFAQKPVIKSLGNDKYEITFAVKGNCDVTVSIINKAGVVIKHIGSGVLGSNAPKPFQKNSLKQTLYWNGKDDLDVYIKKPQKLRLKVSLGLKPEFDKHIGGTSGNNLPGYVWGMAIDKDGVYLMIQGSISHQHMTIRKFDHDGKYIQSLTPAPANLPESKLKGLGYIEYEPGKRAVHGALVRETVEVDGLVFLKFVATAGTPVCQPALSDGRIYFAQTHATDLTQKNPPMPTKLVYIYTDGSTDVKGMRGRPFTAGRFPRPFFAASPDGKAIYMTGIERRRGNIPAVMRCNTADSEEAKVFAGDPNVHGEDNNHLNNPRGIDCDAENRLYVADAMNNRIQIFSPEGKHLKSIPIDRPEFICVHKKTGAIYVLHKTRINGESKGRLSKLKSFEEPQEEFHIDNIWATSIALDSWTSKPRLWMAGKKAIAGRFSAKASGPGLRIFEEHKGKLKKIFDFNKIAKKEAGANYFGHFTGASSDQRSEYGPSKPVCDPVREKLYYRHRFIFDLKTGNYEGQYRIFDRIGSDDIAFDKRGYMHGHSTLNGMRVPRLGRIWRVDPDQAKLKSKGGGEYGIGPIYSYPEVPYNYGVERSDTGVSTPWNGVTPTECQFASHGFQHGFGVNMRGDMVVASRIVYVPKMEDQIKNLAFAGYLDRAKETGYGGGPGEGLYARYKKTIKDMLKQGDVFFVRRKPGISLWGETLWTYDSTGERRFKEYSAILGSRVAGVQMDEDGYLYFVTTSRRLINGKPFLGDRGGTFGMPDDTKNKHPYIGTFVKAKPSGVKILLKDATVPMEPLPQRPPELQRGGRANWIEGAEWLYAGASPIVRGGCECPSSRFHLDWYKRSFIPEAYRHSIGILDTNGNLIMHIGKYGNFDSQKSKKSIANDEIGMFNVRYIGGTDNYLCFDGWGERLVVLKLNYHTEEIVKIK